MVDKKVLVLATSVAMLAFAPPMGLAQEKIEGKVTRTNLTLCHPRPGGGGCEGTLTLEKDGATQQIKVIADTIIKKGQDPLFLPATQGSSVVIGYVTEKGQKVAKTIDVVPAVK